MDGQLGLFGGEDAALLRGIVRTQWEHSIPAVPSLRYSVTVRTLRERASGR